MAEPTPEERARTAREIVERFLDSHGWEVVGYGPRWGQDPRDAAAELAHAITAALAARDEELAQLRATLAAIEEDGAEEGNAAVRLRGELARARGYHRADCNTLLDDESDAVLGDYQECTCPAWAEELAAERRARQEAEGALNDIRNATLLWKRDEAAKTALLRQVNQIATAALRAGEPPAGERTEGEG